MTGGFLDRVSLSISIRVARSSLVSEGRTGCGSVEPSIGESDIDGLEAVTV